MQEITTVNKRLKRETHITQLGTYQENPRTDVCRM